MRAARAIVARRAVVAQRAVVARRAFWGNELMMKLGEEYTKLIGNLQDNRTISGFSVGLQWVYSGSTVGLQWVYSGSTVGL